MLRWTGGQGLDKEEVGKGESWICRVVALGEAGFSSAVPALVQNVGGEPRNRKPVYGAMASAFCFGGEEQIPACSPFAFSSRRDARCTSHPLPLVPAWLVSWPRGADLGGLVHTYISGWYSSVPEEPGFLIFFFFFFTSSIAPGL